MPLYVDLHEHPELSGHEARTASVMAQKLRTAGYEVTEHIGGTGIVAVLKNGDGPTVLLRTELDALPVEEQTGLPYASKVRARNDAGQEVGVMHACGHDIHMSDLYGTAVVMAHSRNTWHGSALDRQTRVILVTDWRWVESVVLLRLFRRSVFVVTPSLE